MRKAFKYRLYPTKPQTRDLEKTLDLCRQLYNAALQERRDAYRKAGKTVGFYEQKRYLPEIRQNLPEYKRIHSQILQDVIQRVDRAFKGFFRRVKAGRKAGYPQDCPVCGYREKKPLWVREYTCPQCEAHLHRDIAAAQVILARARTEPAGMGTARAVPWSAPKGLP